MTNETSFVALPFDRSRDGCLLPTAYKSCSGAEEALREAEAMGRRHAGAIAFSREIDIDAGTASALRILSIIGEVPRMTFLGVSIDT